MINSVLKKSQITSIIEGGFEYSNLQDIANTLNSFYASVWKNISNLIDTDDQYAANSSIVYSFYFKPTTETEIIVPLKDKPCHISAYPVKVLKKLNPKYIANFIQNPKYTAERILKNSFKNHF